MIKHSEVERWSIIRRVCGGAGLQDLAPAPLVSVKSGNRVELLYPKKQP